MSSTWVYGFADYLETDHTSIRDLLGGKGAGLVEMTRMGLPVPPGFILTTRVCQAFYANQGSYPPGLEAQVQQALQEIEATPDLQARFGNPGNPLLLSIRSGAKASMPGMMDTVLNLGLNDATVEGLRTQSQDARFAYDSYRRFIQMYSNVVLGIGLHPFEEILSQYKAVRKVDDDADLSAQDLLDVIEAYKRKVTQLTGTSFPQDVHVQLWGAIRAVLKSWMNTRAISYRDLYHIPHTSGTAVVVQAMVFGNQGDRSATGVAFTRNPSTGENVFFGEYLLKAQGEDVVAGIRTPEPLSNHQKSSEHQKSLEELMPPVYHELVDLKNLLDTHYHDMQDIEFTVQQGKLWLLQTRNGKRTAAASLRFAVDMVDEGLISQDEAVRRFDPLTLDHLLHPRLVSSQSLTLLGKGLPASPGAAVGCVVFTADECVARAAEGEAVILVREETSPEDIQGMAVAKGVLTARGGMTSHAAVVARGMGCPCIAGAGDMNIQLDNQKLSFGSFSIKAGETITLDGATGQIFQGEGALETPTLSDTFTTFMGWADDRRRLQVRANAETLADIDIAKRFGAQGIGLCRTEHMFFDAERILAVREMILASGFEARQAALSKILPMQREAFVEIFRSMDGHPITVRLLDPPLHEFLPRHDSEIEQLAKSLNVSSSVVRHRITALQESNPMLGHRGCRLGVTSPDIYETQIQALFEAAVQCQKDTGNPVQLEIMIPLVALTGELRLIKEIIDRCAATIQTEAGRSLPYTVGTMIELPRAAIKAGKIAALVDFLSFGTNDLTQTTLGLSRDDAGAFLGLYRQKGILERDPFTSLDQSGVGELIRMACEKARAVKPDIKLGVCGEHGADPLSIRFFESLGLDYVSCSPYRLPLARLAAAQAALKN